MNIQANPKNQLPIIKFNVKKYLPKDIKILQEHVIVFIFKSLLSAIIYSIIILPILTTLITDYHRILKYITEEKTLLTCLLIIISINFGVIIGALKDSLIHIIDAIIIIIVLLNIFFDGNFFTLLPEETNIKYSTILILFPITSITYYIIQSIIDQINKNRSYSNSPYIIPDLQLYDLSVYSGVDMRDIDKGLLNYTPFAKTISEALLTIEPYKAFSVGITGDWGSGKSSLIDLILDDLKANESKIEIIKFNPWLYPDETSLIKNFFAEWKRHTNDLFLHLAFDEYAKITSSITYQGLRLDKLDFFRLDQSVNRIKRKIETQLINKKKKFLIVIDDLDRLDKGEILEIAKLSRVIANFPNTIYLLSYSRTYVDAILHNDGPKGAEKYFDKVVQMEFKMPPLNESKVSSYLKAIMLEQLNTLEILNKKHELDKVFEYQYFQNYLPTIRDVIRFSNSFLIKYKLIHKRVNLYTFFFLELFFYKHKYSFNKLYQEREAFLEVLLVQETDDDYYEDIDITKLIQILGIESNEQDKYILSNIFLNDLERNFATHLNDYFILSGYESLEYKKLDQWFHIDGHYQNKEATIQRWTVNGQIKEVINHFTLSVANYSGDNISDFIIRNTILIHTEIYRVTQNSKEADKEDFIEPFLNMIVSLIETSLKTVSRQDLLLTFQTLLTLDIVSKHNSLLQPKLIPLNNQEIISDYNTMFTGSSLDLFKGITKHFSYDEAPLTGYWTENSNTIKQLNNARWITRARGLFAQECGDGNYSFNFERTFFSLVEVQHISRADLYILADDYAEVKVNGVFVIKVGGFEPTKTPSLSNRIDIKEHLVFGINIIEFKVINEKLENVMIGRECIKS